VGIGTYSREFAREVREVAKKHGLEAVISDDYLAVEAKVAEAAPELVLGTQMERHIAKRLGIPCAVISAPIHVQDVPARYSPQMGWEGANVIFDSWVHPLMMGLEEHLIGMFREDFEFAEGHMSHLHTAPSQENRRETLSTESVGEAIAIASTGGSNQAVLTSVEVTQDLQGITCGKIKRNTEKFASDRGLTSITVETLYEAKAAIGK
jgi:light-independent protochlorophyllide reductase subunit B